MYYIFHCNLKIIKMGIQKRIAIFISLLAKKISYELCSFRNTNMEMFLN